jgi:RNA polymerase sigma-70 factor (ECF subfamily)
MTHTTPEDVALDQMTHTMVRGAVESLPESFREAVLLKDVEDFSYGEISDILEVPLGTVMSRIHRGRKLLQKTLYEYALQEGLIATPA